ncbi:MAG: FG-GAP-like repeat-containing protein [Candidatus Polarisedimenticolia bacterium]
MPRRKSCTRAAAVLLSTISIGLMSPGGGAAPSPDLPAAGPASTPTPFFEYEVVARQGEGNIDLFGWPSINDSGQVAYLGTVIRERNSPTLVATVFVANTSGTVEDLTPDVLDDAGNQYLDMTPWNLAHGVEINAGRQVAAHSMFTLDDSLGLLQHSSFAWRFPVLGSAFWGPLRAAGGVVNDAAQSPEPAYFRLVGPWVSMNDSGEIAFVAGDGDVSFPGTDVESLGDIVTERISLVVAPDLAGPELLASYQEHTLATGETLDLVENLAPMIANDGRVVVRAGLRDDSPIEVFSRGLSVSERIAGPDVGFTRIGGFPAISDDGRAVAFLGDRGDGEGLFLSIDDGDGYAASGFILRVAGENATPHPELGYALPVTTLEADGQVRDDLPPLFFASFDFRQRLGITHVEKGRPGFVDDSVIIAFIGRPNAASRPNPVVPGSPLLFSNKEGLWTVRVDFEEHPGTGLLIAQPRSAIPVVQVGDMIEGALVSSVSIYDPLAAARTDLGAFERGRGDHQVAFSVTTSAGRRIVRATHLDTDEDGLLDHWETSGIDMDGDGETDLDLNAMGASPIHKDLFLEIDWLVPRTRGTPMPWSNEPQPGVTERLVRMFAEAPLGNPDGNPGIELHIDAGPGRDRVYRRPFSQNIPPGPLLQGGDLVHKPGLPFSHLDVVPTTGGYRVPSSIASERFGVLKDLFFGTRDKRARELAFHYGIIADFIDVIQGPDSKPYIGKITAVTDDSNLSFSGVPPSVIEGSSILVTSGRASGEIRHVFLVDGAIQPLQDWTRVPETGDTFCVLDDHGGQGEMAVVSSRIDLPGNDHTMGLGGGGGEVNGILGSWFDQWTTLAHELGHNQTLDHCGRSGNEILCDNVTGGITYRPVNAAVVAEGGLVHHLDVTLDSRPSAPVEVDILSEFLQLEAIPSRLRFGTDTWDVPQRVEIRAIDDAIQDRIDSGTEVEPWMFGDLRVILDSEDARFRGLGSGMTMLVYDNERRGVIALRGPGDGLEIVEGGRNDSYEILLTRPPVGLVEVRLDVADPVRVSPATLTFGPADYDVPRTVTLWSETDGLQIHAYPNVLHSFRGDPSYDGLTFEMPFAFRDRESASILVTESAEETEVAEGGPADQVLLELSNAPPEDVTVRIDTVEVNVSPASVTFTPSTWNMPQVIQVQARDDARIAEGVHDGLITLSAEGTAYAQRFVDVDIADNDFDLDPDHRSLMSYAHMSTDAPVNDYAGPGEPLVDEWSRLKLDFYNVFVHLGEFASDASPPLDISLKEYIALFGHPPDVTPPDLVLLDEVRSADVPVSGSVLLRIRAQDEESGMKGVSALVDIDGDGTIAEEEVFPAVKAGTGYYELRLTTAPQQVRLLAEDAAGNYRLEDLALNVVPDELNQPPVARENFLTTGMNTPLAILLEASDSNLAPLTFAVLSSPSSGVLTGTPPQLLYTPNAGFVGFDSFTFRASDGLSPSNTATVRLMVGEANRPPVISQVGSVVVSEGTTLQVAIAATDPDADPVALTATGLPPFAAFVDRGGGSGTLTFSPVLAEVGSYGAIRIEASDGLFHSTVPVPLTVVPFNDPPTLHPIGNRTAFEGFTVRYTIAASDLDGDALSFSIAGLPGFGSFNVVPGRNLTILELSPVLHDAGAYPVTVSVSDGHLQVSEQFSLTVLGDSGEPGIVRIHPSDGSTLLRGLQALNLRFDEPLDPASLAPDRFHLTRSGAPVSSVAFEHRSFATEVILAYAPLPPGSYELTLDAPAITDLSGNPLGDAPFVASRFTLVERPTVTSSLFPDRVYVPDLDGFPGAAAVHSGDLDGDGNLDLVTQNGAGSTASSVSIFLGNGDGTFAERTDLFTIPRGLDIGDVNGDGHLDIVTVEDSPADELLVTELGNGDGTFGPRIEAPIAFTSTLLRPTYLVLGDMDSDGLLDALTLHDFGNGVIISRGAGDGTFTRTSSGGPVDDREIELADVNRDGHVDVVGRYPFVPGGLSIMLGDGAGGLAPALNSPSRSPSFLALGDVNGDDWVDVALTSLRTSPNLVFGDVHLNNGDGTFAAGMPFDEELNDLQLQRDVFLHDLNGDGHRDVILGLEHLIGVRLGAGDGTFGPRSAYPSGRNPQGFAVEDFDRDGDFDIASATGTVSVLLGNGDGTFPVQPDYQAGISPSSVDAGDLDGDGDLDVAIANRGNFPGEESVSVLMGSGDGTFGPATDYTVPSRPNSVRVKDLDGDGFPELLVTSSDSASLRVFPNNDDGTFGAPSIYSISLPLGVAFGDVNGDNVIDVAVAGGGVGIFAGNGDGTLRLLSGATTGQPASSVALGDVDGDGDLDVVAKIDGFAHVRVSLNDGDGFFTTTPDFPATFAPGGVIVLEDVNDDGALDILGTTSKLLLIPGEVPLERYVVCVLPGHGDGTFGPKVDYDTGRFPRDIKVGHIDDDAHLDVLTANGASNSVTLLLGTGDGTFGRRTDYDVGFQPEGVALGDWNGDGRLDFVTANAFSDIGNHRNPGTISPRLQLGGGAASGGLTADAGVNRSVNLGEVVLLDGRASTSSSPGIPLAFEWIQTGGPEVSSLGMDSSTPTFVPDERGTYVFELTVTAGGLGATDSVTIEVVGRPDLILSAADGTTAVVPGEPFTRTLSVTNAGNVAAEGVTLTDTLPLHVVLQEASDGGSPSGQSVLWAPFRLAPQETATRTLTLRIAGAIPAGVEEIVHTASVTDDGSSGQDPTPGNNTAVDRNELLAAPDLSVVLDDGRGAALPGSVLEYGLVVRNLGKQEATGAILRATIPPLASFVSASEGGSFSNGEVSWPHFALPAGDTAARTFTVRLADLWPPGLESISATSTIGDDGLNGPEPRIDDNLAIDTDSVALPELGVSLDDGVEVLVVGQTTTYRIGVANSGTSSATGVVVTDDLPPHTAFLAASHGGTPAGSQVVWPAFDLPAGSSVERTLTLRVEDTVDGSVETLANRASVRDDGAHGPDPILDNNQHLDVDRVSLTTDLSVALAASPATVRVNEVLTYRIEVGNGGEHRARAVRLDLTLPPRVTLNSVDSTLGRCSASMPVSCDLGDLVPRGGGSILVSVVPTQAGSVTALATVSSATVDLDGTNNRSELTTIVQEAASPFTESAAALGLATPGPKEGGLAWCDFDGDGRLDVLVNAADTSHLYVNEGAGFQDVTASHAAGLLESAAPRSAICADLNNDGHVDFARNAADRIEIYLNRGPQASPPFSFGLPLDQRPHQIIDGMDEGMSTEGMGFLDYDHDGDLDLVVDNDSFGIDVFENNHNGHFQHVTKNDRTLGLPQEAISGDYLAVADYDADGWVDVLSRKESLLDLWRNLGDGSFGPESSFDGDALDANKGGVAFCDLDADGDFDILWTDADSTQIWRNHDGAFVPTGEPSASSGVGLGDEDIDGVACADVDNDGDLDVFLAANIGDGHLFVNESTGGSDDPLVFRHVNGGISIGADAEAVAFGDYDLDGDQDILVNVDGAPNQLWTNSTGGESFLMIRALRCLYGNDIDIDDGDGLRRRIKGFRDDVGATIRIFAEDGATPTGPVQEVNGGTGHGSQNPAYVHYGLPEGADEIYVVEVSFVGGPVVRRQVRPGDLGPSHLAVVSSCGRAP